MPENEPNSMAGAVHQARQQLSEELRAQNEELQKLEQSLDALRNQHKQLEQAVQRHLETVGELASLASGSGAGGGVPLDKVLASVGNLITATLPEQVLATLAEEAEQMGVRAAVFDIRGKAAWGASARGFGPGLSEKAFRALVVPLNKDSAFLQAYETGGHVEATVEVLKKSRNVLDKLNPSPQESVLLIPIRSAGSVSAIFYSDPGGRGQGLPVEALKILAEFAGAQLDRLMALSGGLHGVAAERGRVEAEPEPEPVATPEPRGRAAGKGATGGASSSAPETGSSPWAQAHVPFTQTSRPSEPSGASPVPRAAGGISQISEADQKVHKDAQRFAKLLISEIELYNKTKVLDGRKNSDLYRRLKVDIDRSRQTYEKRFGKTVAKEVDYFHTELVKTLAGNEPSLLGADYPGPSV